MRLIHRPHFTRLVARLMCWVMLYAWAAGVANACTAPGATAALSTRAAQHFHEAASLEVLASPEPCHIADQALPDSRVSMDADACKTFCEAETSGRVAVKSDVPPPPLALALLQSDRWIGPASGEPSQRLYPRHPTDKPPPPRVAVLFLRLTI